MLDVEIFGVRAGGHHAGNVLLHLINSLLCFLTFRKLTGNLAASAVVAALFAVHPAHVESVAWVSERKDMLSTMFFFLSMWAYGAFARGDRGSGLAAMRSRPFILSVAFFALGLMAKPMLVTVPFVLLLLDYWPLGRLSARKDLGNLFAEKIPYFILAAASSVITYRAQQAGGAVESLEYLALDTRAMNAVTAYVKYLAVLVYPANLGLAYPYPASFPWWQVAGAALILIAITAVCWIKRSSHPYLIVGWLVYLGTLVPVIGLVQVGSQSMADRYTYVPFLGLFTMIAWGLKDIAARQGLGTKAYVAGTGVVIVALTAVAYVQAGRWESSETIYRHTLAVTDGNALISHNLCLLLAGDDRLDEGERYCHDAIGYNPRYPESYNTLGIIAMKRKHYDIAEHYFGEYLQRTPNDATGYSNLALSQILNGKPEEGEQNLRRAGELNRGTIDRATFAAALGDLSIAYAEKENYAGAADILNRQLNLFPENVDVRYRLASALYLLERYGDARGHAEIVAEERREEPAAANLFGKILLELGERERAGEMFERVIRIDPNFEDAKENLRKAQGEK
jgi:tetratricopeptide (TPR) repeat protein